MIELFGTVRCCLIALKSPVDGKQISYHVVNILRSAFKTKNRRGHKVGFSQQERQCSYLR